MYLSHLIKRNRDEAFRTNYPELTFIHFRIIKYLNMNHGRPVFQRDLEHIFNVRRSTMSGTIDIMEKNGFVTRESVDSDKRLKRIVLTDQARQVGVRDRKDIDDFEKSLAEGLSKEEQKELEGFLDRMIYNLASDGPGCERMMPKEEEDK